MSEVSNTALFDARFLQINWLNPQARKNLQSSISGLSNLSDDMQQSQTPGYERVKAAHEKVEQTLRPLLELRPLLSQTHAPFKALIANTCRWHVVHQRKVSPAEILKGRAAKLAEIACDDDMEDAVIAKGIVRQITHPVSGSSQLAPHFIKKLNEQSCHAIRDKLPASDLRRLQKLAAEKPDPAKTHYDIYKHPEDAGDYLREDRSKPARQPSAEVQSQPEE